MKKKYIDFINEWFSERALVDSGETAKEFISYAESMGSKAFDASVVDRYREDPDFVEKELIKSILSVCDIPLDIEYFSRFVQNISAKSRKTSDETVILFDELLKFITLDFFLTVFSLATNKDEDNFKRCFKNFIVSLDLQGRKRLLGTFDPEEVKRIILLPDNIENIALDCYWAAWTFIVGHEMYHLCYPDKERTKQTEIEADQFGYQVLINMIMAQKAGQIRKDLQVYAEYTYLAPNMILEYIKLKDFYLDLCKEKNPDSSHPDPAIRQDNISDLFDSMIPENMNTVEGNAVFYAFIQITDLLKEQLVEKYNKGKLDSIIKNKPQI